MKIYHDPGFIRIHLLHSIASQIPMDVSKAFYDLASGWCRITRPRCFCSATTAAPSSGAISSNASRGASPSR